MNPFPASMNRTNPRMMIFVDGENLAIRFKELLNQYELQKPDHIVEIPNVFVWSEVINKFLEHRNIIRKYYFTSCVGDENKIQEIESFIRKEGFEAPRVFKGSRGRKSKRVDIAMATEILLHGFRDNYDYALIITGDEDFIPAIKAISNEGKRILLWYLNSSTNQSLIRCADHVYNLEPFLIAKEAEPWGHLRGEIEHN